MSRTIAFLLFLAMFLFLILAPLAQRAKPLVPPHYNEDIATMADMLDLARYRLAEMDRTSSELRQTLEEIDDRLTRIQDVVRAKLGKLRTIRARVTAYTPYYESTQKTPSHPLFNVTASGKDGGFGICAADPVWPFGTVFYIPGLGACVVLDRGGAIRNRGDLHTIDYMVAPPWVDRQTAVRIARQWGVRVLEVSVLHVP